MPPTDGFLLVDKPAGPTSYDIIRWIKPKLKGALKGVKIGHAGTLDPIASGLLIVLVGKATKRQSDVMGSDKVYRCRMRFGLRTDTADISGQVVERSEAPPPDPEKVSRLLSRLTAETSQIPPMYSALKRNGVPLYKLARKGEVVERAPRKISIRWVEPLGPEEGDAAFRVSCSSGTYVRTLIEDVGNRAGVGGTMVSLVRESIGPFQLKDAVPGAALKDWDAEQIFAALLPVDAVPS